MRDLKKVAREYVKFKEVTKLIDKQRDDLVAAIDEKIEQFKIDQLDKMDVDALERERQRFETEPIEQNLLKSLLRLRTRKKAK